MLCNGLIEELSGAALIQNSLEMIVSGVKSSTVVAKGEHCLQILSWLCSRDKPIAVRSREPAPWDQISTDRRVS